LTGERPAVSAPFTESTIIAHYSSVQTLLKHAFFLLAAAIGIAFLTSGCKDNISSLGLQYFPDTVVSRTSVRTDSSFMQFADTLRPSVFANGVNYNLTIASPVMFIGNVAMGNQNLTSSGVLKFRTLAQDSIALVTKVRLLLRDQLYKYGDTSSNNSSMLSLQVVPNFSITDSTTVLPPLGAAVASIDTAFPDDSDALLAIPLDTSVISNLSASSLSFVVTPGATMTNCRAFGTADNADTGSQPKLELTLSNGSVVYLSTLSAAGGFDMYIVKDMSLTPTGEFTVQGGIGKRERVMLNLTRPNDTAQLTTFTSVNSATLVLHLDPDNTRLSNRPFDNGTTGPSVVRLSTNDSGAVLDAFGYPTDTTHTVYKFQVRGLVEYWLRNPSTNLGFELRAGAQSRSIGSEAIPVEDNILNRWTFYGPHCADTSKRPELILSYSKLR